MTNEDLVVFLEKWQKIMHLQDWDISIRLARPFEIGPDRGGEVTRVEAKKVAVVSVLNPADFDPGKIITHDPEYTVVHELVHLHFSLIDDFDGVKDTLYEQAVHLLAKSLISLDRSSQPSVVSPQPISAGE